MKDKHSFDVVFVLILFFVFTSAVLSVLLAGAGAYKNINAAAAQQYQERTCLNYIATKIRHYNAQDAVGVGELDGIPALQLRETLDGVTYATYIYYYDGCVRELYFEEAYPLTPDAGLEIIEAESLSFTALPDGLLRIACTGTSGAQASLCIGACTAEQEAAG